LNLRREIDEIDALILERLQREGRVTQSALSSSVGRSVPAISARIRRLEEDGIILGFHAALDPKRLRHDVTAFVSVSLRRRQDVPRFLESLRGIREVLEIHAIADEKTHLLKLRTENTSRLERLLRMMEKQMGIERISASIVLSTHRETQRIPICPDLRPSRPPLPVNVAAGE